jgi:hypothetical protein
MSYMDGQIVSSVAPLTMSQYLVVLMGGAVANVLYAGSAPGLVDGVIQVNAPVPTIALVAGGIAAGNIENFPPLLLLSVKSLHFIVGVCNCTIV